MHGISDAELVDLIRSAEVACVPSLYEGFSLPAVEAMSCGTALVSTTGGAIPEVAGRDGETTLAVPPGDASALAGALTRVLRDAELRARLGAAARERVLECSRGAPPRSPPPSATARSSRPTGTRSTGTAWPPTGSAVAERQGSDVLTVDFERFPIAKGEKVLDMGCGFGRHAFALLRQGADVVALDHSQDEVAEVAKWFAAMRTAGEVPAGASAIAVRGTAYGLPFADGTFDAIVAAEVLEHLPDDRLAMSELVRVLKPGGRLAVTVPRWFPEKVCWALSDAYHEVEGGHIRIYKRREMIDKLRAAGVVPGAAAPRARAARAVLVAEVRGRRRQRERPGEGVQEAPGVGHHQGAGPHPRQRGAAEPGARQEPGRLRAASPPHDGAVRAAASPVEGLAAATGLLACEGVLSAAQVRTTVEAIAALQRPDGAIPWFHGGHLDPWDHIEAAMALDAAGRAGPRAGRLPLAGGVAEP